MPAKTYVAVEDFSLNMDNGKKYLDVKKGDIVVFDGLYAECKGEGGAARSLAKVVGEWIKPLKGDPDKIAKLAASARAIPEGPPGSQSRNVTGGQIVENSSVDQEARAPVSRKDDYAELQDLVDQQEASMNRQDAPKVADDLADAQKESRVIDQDDTIVADVSPEAQTDVQSNVSGVTVQEQDNSPRTVVAQEERVVKETDYSDSGPVVQESRRKLQVDTEADGVEVRKVTTPAINANEVTAGESTDQVVADQDVVVATSHGDTDQHTDIGSSTQSRTTAPKKGGKKASAGKKTSTKKASSAGKRSTVRVVEQQDGQVVAKTTPIEESKSSQGITSKMTIGPSQEMEVGDVEFSSNSEMTGTEAVVSAGETTPVQVATADDDGIDVNDILSSM